MATTRLRKRFQYPADNSGDDDTPLEIDEEEQEKLIAKLRRDNEKRNDEYTRIFLAIPTISMWTYLPALVNSRLLQAKIISLLGMTSLVATTYLLIYVPNTKPSATDRRPLSARFEREPSPIHKHLGSLNVGLSVLVALNSITFRGRVGVHDGFWILCLLPGVVLSIIVMARRVMLSVDVGELESLKYEYKGA